MEVGSISTRTKTSFCVRRNREDEQTPNEPLKQEEWKISFACEEAIVVWILMERQTDWYFRKTKASTKSSSALISRLCRESADSSSKIDSRMNSRTGGDGESPRRSSPASSKKTLEWVALEKHPIFQYLHFFRQNRTFL
ncbi:hypothetical protein MA16_Dca004344 [Dendrobium catenatum]|uniref:Uncharacterized protein n=1 Tax=Dendrobium catenatum TaxID=906689 RepID=A0A2I0W769_9ASPA|nr:hypothetical protein MA16_Dca004344 [Dendrobium catenatum]